MNHLSSTMEHGDLFKTIEANINYLQDTFKSSTDITFYKINLNGCQGVLVYLSQMVDESALYAVEEKISKINQPVPNSNASLLTREEKIQTKESAVNYILEGRTVLLMDQKDYALTFRTSNYIGRKVEEPRSESVVRGPKQGFVEDIETNIQLVRKRLKTPSLKIDQFKLGTQTNTQVNVVYLDGIADEEIVKEVHERLSRINIDGILESHYVESMITDSPKSPFPTVYSTELPDRVCGGLLEGKVAIFIDGTPYVLTVPALFVEYLHTNEDYYNPSLISTIVRWVRFLGLFVTMILPAFYVAITTFHQDLLQTPFFLRIAASREGLPYPVLVEGFFLYLTYELCREAGLRMPKVFGGAVVTILGLILVGQAAVQAGIIGPVMAIVVIVTSLTSFILPNYAFHQVIRFLGLPLLFLAGFFGFMGIIVGLMFGLAHIVSLRSFGVPYFSPVSPARKEGWKDVFIRGPWWAMDTRPPGLGIENNHRAEADNHANSPHDQEEEDRNGK